VWSVATGVSLQTLRFHEAAISQAVFSPDGRWIVTAGPSDAGLWETRTGELLLFLSGTDGALRAAAFSADNSRFVTGALGGTVATYDCTVCGRVAKLRALATARLRGLR